MRRALVDSMDLLPLVRKGVFLALAVLAFAAYHRFGLTVQGIAVALVAMGLMVLLAFVGRATKTAEANGCRECGLPNTHAHGFCTMCGHQPA